EAGRLGQKTGAGWFRYEKGDRTPHPDPEVARIIKQKAAEMGVPQRSFTDEEILRRLLFASVNEACKILEEGKAYRASDIDVMWLNGFGFPRYRGGLMYWADGIGVAEVYRQIQAWHQQYGERWTPSPLLRHLADLGYADVSCYGRPDLSTPNIDRLAAEGLRFMQAYANSAVCTASRVALITGRYQYRLAVGLEEPLAGASPPGTGLPPNHPSLPSLLRKIGYQSALIGKWHLGRLPDFGPLQSGYDHFYGFRGGALDYFTHKFGPPQSATEDLWDDDTKVEQPGYLTDLLGNRAVEIVDSFAKSGRPFLVSLHFNAPHWPWEAPGDEVEAQR